MTNNLIGKGDRMMPSLKDKLSKHISDQKNSLEAIKVASEDIGDTDLSDLDDFELTDDVKEAFRDAMHEVAEQEKKKKSHPHYYANQRAVRARALAAEKGVSLGKAVAMVMEEENAEPQKEEDDGAKQER
jgi:hypothetical protein